MKLKIFIVIVSAILFTSANTAFSYVPDNLDFVPMGDGADSRGQPAAPSGRTYTISSINYKMVHIPPGTFMMGWSSKPGRVVMRDSTGLRLQRGFTWAQPR